MDFIVHIDKKKYSIVYFYNSQGRCLSKISRGWLFTSGATAVLISLTQDLETSFCSSPANWFSSISSWTAYVNCRNCSSMTGRSSIASTRPLSLGASPSSRQHVRWSRTLPFQVHRTCVWSVPKQRMWGFCVLSHIGWDIHAPLKS